MAFQVRWKGYDSGEDTWEPEENLGTAKLILEEYMASHQDEVKKAQEDAKKAKEEIARKKGKRARVRFSESLRLLVVMEFHRHQRMVRDAYSKVMFRIHKFKNFIQNLYKFHMLLIILFLGRT